MIFVIQSAADDASIPEVLCNIGTKGPCNIDSHILKQSIPQDVSETKFVVVIFSIFFKLHLFLDFFLFVFNNINTHQQNLKVLQSVQKLSPLFAVQRYLGPVSPAVKSTIF